MSLASSNQEGRAGREDFEATLPAHAARLAVKQAQGSSQVPLLLKPNGVPVFQNVGGDPENLDRTVRMNRDNGPGDELQRTVKAHSFVAGKKIQNQTEIAKCSQAEDQAMPVRIVYVKPGLNRPAPLVRQPKEAGATLKPLNQAGQPRKENGAPTIDAQFERDISMGDISGIFAAKDRRVKSAPHSEKEKRIAAQKAYAEQVRKQSKIKEQARQQALKEREATAQPGANAEEPQPPVKAASEDPLSRVPHAANRFQGQYGKLTKDLFRKAQDRVRAEKLQEKEQEGLTKEKREKEAKLQEDIKLRNQENFKQQRGKGLQGPSLREREACRKEEELRARKEVERAQRKELRAKRAAEDKAQLGLDQIDRHKLREHQEQKLRGQMQEEAVRRAQQHESHLQQRARDRHVLNKDLIDFTHADSARGMPDAGQSNRMLEDSADEAAEPIADKKQILREQQMKRKQQEQEKQRQEEAQRRKKQQGLEQLEEHLRQQRNEIAKRQYLSQERVAKKAEQHKAVRAAAAKRPKSKKDRTEQLNDLRTWIEEQMRIEDVRTQEEAQTLEAQPGSPQKDKSSLSAGVSKPKSNANLAGQSLPGNNLIPLQDEKKHGARQNRYGLQGDNGYTDVVQEQRRKEGLSTMSAKKENILDFTQKESSPQKSDKKSEGSVDLQPVREEKRAIVNQPLPSSEVDRQARKMPGVLHAKDEANRQKAETKKREEWAAVIVQKWARGWQDRKAVSRRRSRMKREIDYEHAQFTNEFKMNEQFNLNKFISQKAKLRQLNQTEGIDEESITEQIVESMVYTDIQTESYIRSQIGQSQSGVRASRGEAMVQNFFQGPAPKHAENDPLSIISIFAKRKAAPSQDQMVPERDRKEASPPRKAKKVSEYKEAKRASPTRAQPQRQSKPAGRHAQPSSKSKKQTDIDEEIDEEIEKYTSEYSSEHISESIASFQGPSLQQATRGEQQDSSMIEESIQESLPHGSRENLAAKMQTSGTNDSIPEEDHLKKSASESLVASKVQEDDSISEESYLRESTQKQGESQPRPSYVPAKPVVQTFSKKVDRIRENIEEDYDNDGFDSYSGSLKANKLREQQALEAKQKHQDYRMSRDIINDFEEQKGIDESKHKQLLTDLKQELNRYEQAVSGSIFVEQFQTIVNKSLAQKDMLMLAQRLASLEAESKHKQEIADIREEQIRMMSQLMLLNASQGQGKGPQQSAGKIQKQQATIMHNIQKLIDKPIIIQAEGSVDMSTGKEAKGLPKARRGPEKRASSEEEIEDEIESDIQGGSDEDSIAESIDQSRSRQSEQQQLSSARRLLGSEQAVIESSKELLDRKSKPAGSVFDRGSFQNYTTKKFKDLLLNEGTMMEGFLNEIEAAVAKKSQEEKKQLQRQLDTKMISTKAYQKKSRDLEKWVTGERNEIRAKRAKVQDTCTDISSFMQKMEQDKKLMLDCLGSASNTPRGLRRSSSQLTDSQDSEGLRQVKDQLRGIREGHIGGERPETKYLNKKRDFVRQLMKEKRRAVESGVREKMKNYESEMIDEMLQAALNLDVDKEVESRIEVARKVVEEGRVDESSSKPAKPYKPSHTRSGKKNVKFQSPKRAERYSSSSYSQHPESSVSKSGQLHRQIGASIGEMDEDMIGESIKIEESYQPSATSASKSKKSESLRQSAGKASQSMPHSQSRKDQDEDSLERDEDVDYSNEFISESIPSASLGQSETTNLQSAKALQQKAADIEESGYTEAFDDVSIGQSQSTQLKKQLNDKSQAAHQIDIVNEEEDNFQDSSHLRSEAEGSSPQDARDSSRMESSQVDHSGELRESAPSPPKETAELTDREVSQSTTSVDWQIVLQARTKREEPRKSDEMRKSSPTQDYQDSDVEEKIEEKSELEADGLEDLESCPSGSLVQSKPDESGDFDLKVDQITDELLNSILRDFKQDSGVKMEVEDLDEAEFEDKWPYTLDKKQEEAPVPVPKPQAPGISAAEAEEQKQAAEREQENEAKRKHDELMEKYHEEQKTIAEHHQKVVEYLDFMIEIVDREVLQQALQKPIEHDPLKILEKIQAFDTEDEIDITAMAYSQQQSALPPDLFDEIEKRCEEVRMAKEEADREHAEESKVNSSAMSQETRNIYHLGIFDAFNEALDQERPYKFKGLPNPWSRQTRVTNETLSAAQVDQIIKRARDRVIEWDKTGAGTKFAPPPPPPPPSGDFDPISPPQAQMESEEERNKAERQARLGQLLTKEVHQREQDWLDYEVEDTQVRFDLADMILEELADEVTQFLVDKAEPLQGLMDEHY